MKKIIAYYVIRNSRKDLIVFIDEVTKAMTAGWQPLGGMACDEWCLFQAMVKYE
jgi:hypothetical protein